MIAAPHHPATPPGIWIRTGRFEDLGCMARLHRAAFRPARIAPAKPSPFQAQGEISPGKGHTPSSHNRRIYAASPWSQELRGLLPTRPAWQRLLCGSCSSARDLCSTLPTLGRPHAVAVQFTHCDQLAAGLAPAGVRPCWAHTKKPTVLPRWVFGLLTLNWLAPAGN